VTRLEAFDNRNGKAVPARFARRRHVDEPARGAEALEERGGLSTIVATASAISQAEVGAPIWSETMPSSSRSRASRAIVRRKFVPVAA
jgi:hypothetical protein